ncbi:hypothetical protein FGB62_103g03 [Gracilaria domingensis]|nr:hypothetical protein FGB62_103g03 [Gracilaria domingensis]
MATAHDKMGRDSNVRIALSSASTTSCGVAWMGLSSARKAVANCQHVDAPRGHEADLYKVLQNDGAAARGGFTEREDANLVADAAPHGRDQLEVHGFHAGVVGVAEHLVMQQHEKVDDSGLQLVKGDGGQKLEELRSEAQRVHLLVERALQHVRRQLAAIGGRVQNSVQADMGVGGGVDVEAAEGGVREQLGRAGGAQRRRRDEGEPHGERQALHLCARVRAGAGERRARGRRRRGTRALHGGGGGGGGGDGKGGGGAGQGRTGARRARARGRGARAARRLISDVTGRGWREHDV